MSIAVAKFAFIIIITKYSYTYNIIPNKERGKTMQITIFAKRKTTRDGKRFYAYFSTLKKKTGEDVTVQVKFKEKCGNPDGDKCPMNIVFDKSAASYREKLETYVDRETGEEKKTLRRTMWVSAWRIGEEYVDTSMDEFE